MPYELSDEIRLLLQQEYDPCASPSATMRAFLRVAQRISDSPRGLVCLGGTSGPFGRRRGFVVVDEARAMRIEHAPCGRTCDVWATMLAGRPLEPFAAHNASATCCLPTAPDGASVAQFPLRYQRGALGLLVLASDRARHVSSATAEMLQEIADEIARHLKRHEIARRMRARLGKELRIVGTSQALRRADLFVEKASQVRLPVVIVGEPGTETDHVAHAIHFVGPRRRAPFAEIQCETIDEERAQHELAGVFRRTRDGTVYLNGIDRLGYRAQGVLLDMFASRAEGSWTDAAIAPPPGARIVASSSRSLNDLALEGSFSAPLLAELDYLRLAIPPLRERPEDIKPLVAFYLHRTIGDAGRPVSADVLELIESYEWPRNARELERVVTRLAVLSGDVITRADVAMHAPSIEATRQTVAAAAPARRPRPASGDAAALRVVRALLESRGTDETASLHPGVRRAVEYLAGNYQESIALEQLARHAGLSASHLSFLLQKSLGTTFKNLLALVRVEKAKRLLAESPYTSVTDVSGEAGFGELSQFERTFKRLVGCTPREFRRSALRGDVAS